MSNIIPFESPKVPAHIAAMFGSAESNDLVGNSAGGGFPVISIKGKVFHVQRGDERTLVTKPGEDDPASSIEVVVIKANPNRSKVFYATGYEEGSVAKPTCYSNDGIAPATDATEAQSKKCATCVHNQWGARISESGKKMKACTDSRRLAVATLDAPADPMLLRVPAASMRAMEDYGKILAARGVRPEAVVTKIGFDYSVAHPALTFKPVGLIGDQALLAEIKKVSQGELAAQIVGVSAAPVAAESEREEAEAPAQQPKSEPVAESKSTQKRVAAQRKTAEDAADAAAAAAPAGKKADVTVAETSKLEGELKGLIADLNFDD